MSDASSCRHVLLVVQSFRPSASVLRRPRDGPQVSLEQEVGTKDRLRAWVRAEPQKVEALPAL